MKSTSAKLIIIFVASTIVSFFTNGYDVNIINYSTILNTLMSSFAVSFAIVAIMFTILDRYKEKTNDPKLFLERTQCILSELIEDTIGLFALIVSLFIVSLTKNIILICNFKYFNLYKIILVFSLFLMFALIFDILCSTKLLIKNLNNFDDTAKEDFEITSQERTLIQEYRNLVPENRKVLLENMKLLNIKQTIAKNHKNQ